MSDNPRLNIRRLLLAIASIQTNPHLFSKDEVIRVLAIAGTELGGLSSYTEGDIDEAVNELLDDMEPDGRA